MANNSQFTGIQPIRQHVTAPLGPPQSALPSMPMQFRPAIPPQQPPPYIPVDSQQYLPLGRSNIGVHSITQQVQFPPPMMHQSRPGQAGHVMPLPLPIPMPDVQLSRPAISVSPQAQQTSQTPNNYMPGLTGPRMPISSTYVLSVPSSGPLQINGGTTTQYQSISQTNVPSFPAGEQAWASGSQSIKSVTPALQSEEQLSHAIEVVATATHHNIIEKTPSDWTEPTRDGKRFYYNKKMRLSSWEKPIELMTAIERADASTDWREITSPDGRKYYYNRVTKKSTWSIPDEVELAREKVKMESSKGTQESSKDTNFLVPASVSSTVIKASSPIADTDCEVVSSPYLVAHAIAVESVAMVTSGSSSLCIEPPTVATNATVAQTPLESVPPLADTSGSTEVPVISVNTDTPMSNSDDISPKDVETAVDGVFAVDVKEIKNGTSTDEKVVVAAVEEKFVDQEPVIYENKLEAKNAFKKLLETANVGSDWSWDQAMRVIINDRRYGALRTLGERKQTFNEFLGQKKKQEAEERRAKQKKAREDYKKMLEESRELTASTRWSKVISIFEDDERFKAVERAKDREDLFEDYIVELEKMERAKALEEHKRNRMEYIEFLKSCDFIKASSQWRKVQDRLESDERCLRLEKFDRLEIFQEYLRDLEKEEEEQRKLRMEDLRKAERRNRDEFRKLMEEHVAAGTLGAKTHWRDYCLKVKELPAYVAVSSNTSGATAKDLFEDVVEELEKQYLEDKTWIKDEVRLRKIAISSTWTIEDFKAAILEDISSPAVSDINLELVFDELQERVREREEKEAKRRKRLADDFYEFLCSYKEITASSRWEDCNSVFEDRFNREESFSRETFEKYITELKEKARDKERKRREEKDKMDREAKDRDKRKAKHRRDRERGKGKERAKKDASDSENGDESYSLEENRRSGRDKERKHRKRHPSTEDDTSFDEKEKDRLKSSHRHNSDSKKSKQMEQQSEADYDSRHKRHKRDHHSGSHRNVDYEEHKERENGEDGEVL